MKGLKGLAQSEWQASSPEAVLAFGLGSAEADPSEGQRLSEGRSADLFRLADRPLSGLPRRRGSVANATRFVVEPSKAFFLLFFKEKIHGSQGGWALCLILVTKQPHWSRRILERPVKVCS